MKLSGTSWVILSIGIFVVIAAGLGFTRSQQIQEQVRVDEELGVAEMRLDSLQIKQLRQRQVELQERLDTGIIQLTAAKDSLRQSIESINVTDEFFAMARSSGVEVTGLSSSSIVSKKLGAVDSSVITINAVVTGSVLNQIDFIVRLNNGFTTGVVESAQISIPEAADEDATTANILVVVHTYEGD